MKLTIREIANMAGVSVTTVSQILNNKGSRFSEKTRQKVLQIVEEHQYKPDFFASNIITRHSQTIGMIVPDVTDFFFSKVVEGVESYLHSLGYMILLCNSKHSIDKENQYVKELMHRSVDGIILATPHVLPPDHCLEKQLPTSFPTVLIDRGINTREHGQLLVKEYEGASEAMEYLIAHGHRHIGMLRETQDYYQLMERVTAYHDVLTKHGLPLIDSYVQRGELTLKGGYHAAGEVLKNEKITAIFCGNDEMAIGAYQAIYERNLRIPEDISVIGFDGLEISEYLAPALTTVYQPAFDIGYYAAKFLVGAINKEVDAIPNKLFETTFIERKSTRMIDIP